MLPAPTQSQIIAFMKEGATLKQVMDAIEKKIILETLTEYKTQTAAAHFLGVTRQGLIKKLKRLGIQKQSESNSSGD